MLQRFLPRGWSVTLITCVAYGKWKKMICNIIFDFPNIFFFWRTCHFCMWSVLVRWEQEIGADAYRHWMGRVRPPGRQYQYYSWSLLAPGPPCSPGEAAGLCFVLRGSRVLFSPPPPPPVRLCGPGKVTERHFGSQFVVSKVWIAVSSISWSFCEE